MHSTALAITKDLNLDMARFLQVFFDIDFIIAKGCFGFRPCGAKGNFQLFRVARHFHTTPTAAGGGLDNHGKTDFRGHPNRRFIISNTAI